MGIENLSTEKLEEQAKDLRRAETLAFVQRRNLDVIQGELKEIYEELNRRSQEPERNSLGTCAICHRHRYRADGIICTDCAQDDPEADLEMMGYFEIERERDSTSPEFDPNNPHDVEAARLK